MVEVFGSRWSGTEWTADGSPGFDRASEQVQVCELAKRGPEVQTTVCDITIPHLCQSDGDAEIGAQVTLNATVWKFLAQGGTSARPRSWSPIRAIADHRPQAFSDKNPWCERPTASGEASWGRARSGGRRSGQANGKKLWVTYHALGQISEKKRAE
ncbi:uncharacterized protein BO80DRAFT_36893 [Aspergillus ibericus CBS 121593]|uniref:Uncharacterized protein n=1 Tax=Aspergillus ibericus CBS 121593 TaxID=1448316 RepID=A0A395H6M2_9EURO|nr:hypothetical protein BO80DRAFT_36893 [Aspergillus ibericus CBS 121593]RAL02518.1 hypothetical protein BO80DRAFT_36893 [Aspergillus ibericus CBS 121593]